MKAKARKEGANTKLGALVSLICVVSWMVGGAAAGDSEALLALARTPPADYPREREGFLRTHTNRFDVVQAATTGWEAGLLALILNSRLDHPEAYRQFDAQFPSREPGENGSVRYRSLWLASAPVEASAFELLWKGGRLDAPDRQAAGITNEYALLPAGARANIFPGWFHEWRRKPAIGATVPEILLLSIVEGNAPEDVKAMASYILASRESEAAHMSLFQVLTNANVTARTKDAVFLGIEDYTPSYGWAVLRESFSSWGQNMDLLSPGYRVLADITNSLGRALVRSIALDTNAPSFARLCALSVLGASRDEGVVTLKTIVQDPNESSELKLRAINELMGYPKGQRQKFIEELDLSKLEPNLLEALLKSFGTPSVVLIRLMAERDGKQVEAEPEELRFIRTLADRSDLSPASRKAAQDVAEQLTKMLKK
jgi:hypothetical protein